MLRQNNNARRSADYEEYHDRRNPYLVDYEEQLRRRRKDPGKLLRENNGFRPRTVQGNGQKHIVSMPERRTGAASNAYHSDGQQNGRGGRVSAEEVADRLSLLYGNDEVLHPTANRKTVDRRRTTYEGETGSRQGAVGTGSRKEQRGYGQAARERGFEGSQAARRYGGGRKRRCQRAYHRDPETQENRRGRQVLGTRKDSRS